jgi:hypothetical protein
MAVIFEQIEASVVKVPIATGADQQQTEKKTVDPAEIRRMIEVMTERGSRLDAD